MADSHGYDGHIDVGRGDALTAIGRDDMSGWPPEMRVSQNFVSVVTGGFCRSAGHR